MESYITDAIYYNTQKEKSIDVELAEKRFYTELSFLIPEKEYIRLEEELNNVYSILEKELFYRGFIEGIRFLLGCMK